jgi:glycosyltransferase involved in cell wall biosynthesis
VTEIVREGVNGFLFPLDARGDRYAARIAEVFSDEVRYQQLRNSSREQYETRLNWDAWGQRMNEILAKAVNPSIGSQAFGLT